MGGIPSVEYSPTTKEIHAFSCTSLHWLLLQDPLSEVIAHCLKQDKYVERVNSRNIEGLTPLHFAAMYSTRPRSLQYLIRAGADVEAKSYRSDATPLHLAVERMDSATVRVLLRNGANKHAQDCDQETPLTRAWLQYVKSTLRRGGRTASSSDTTIVDSDECRRVWILMDGGCQMEALGELFLRKSWDGDARLRRRVSLFLRGI